MKTFTGTKQEINRYLFNLDSDTLYDVTIEKHKQKRSLKANRYAWELMTQIARKMIKSKEEIYLRMLSDYGVVKHDENGSIIEGYFDVRTNLTSIGSYWKFIEYVNVNNKVKMRCLLLKGSSEYNSKEMYDFIKGIEQDAELLGIETLSELEFKSLIEEMKKYEQ